MPKLGLAVVAAIVVAAATAHDARSSSSVALSGELTVSSLGAHAQAISFAHDWSISTSPQDDRFLTKARWAGIFIIQRTANPLSIGIVEAAAPEGCSAHYCAHPGGYRNVFSNAPASPATGADQYVRFSFPAGRYWIYALAPSGTRMSAVLQIRGLPGPARIAPQRPVTAAEAAVRTAAVDVVSASGQFSISLRRSSVLMLSVWRSTLPNQMTPTVASTHACLDSPSSAPDLPASSDTCMDIAPSNQVGGIGARDADSGGFSVGTWASDAERPGAFKVAYALKVVGQQAAAGVLAVWFDRL